MDEMQIPLWQSQGWENLQKSLRHKVLRFGENKEKTLLQIHPLFLGKNYAYIPRGPVHKQWTDSSRFLIHLGKIAKQQKLIFTRIDPELPFKLPKTAKTVPAHSNQPDTSLILNLRQCEADLLAQMKRKGRYNIKLAEQKGIQIKTAHGSEEIQEFVSLFYQLLLLTTVRDSFAGHDENYYQKFLQEIPSSSIMLAYYRDIPLAGGIFCFLKPTAIYYYGASSDRHRELMAPYLLQWEAIKCAQKKGCTSYDFLGIAPEDAADNHPWKGITAFKSKFGGKIVCYPAALDIIHRPIWYKIYKLLKYLQKIIKK